MKALKRWKENPKRMPLLLNGARQVGKTYTALTFGKQYYRNTVVIAIIFKCIDKIVPKQDWYEKGYKANNFISFFL